MKLETVLKQAVPELTREAARQEKSARERARLETRQRMKDRKWIRNQDQEFKRIRNGERWFAYRGPAGDVSARLSRIPKSGAIGSLVGHVSSQEALDAASQAG